MLTIDEDLRSLIESGVAISIGTRSAEMVPHAVRGWGAKASPDGRSVEVFIDRPAATACVADLQDNGRVACTFVDVTTLRSLQLKGRCVELGDPLPEDWARIDRQREAFTVETGKIGFVREMVRNLWSTQVVKIRFVVEEF